MRPSFPARDTSQSDSFFSDIIEFRGLIGARMRRLPCSLRLSAWLLDSSPRVLRRRQQSYEGTVAGNGETKKPRARQGFVDTKSRLDRRTVPKRLQARSYAVSGVSQGIDSGSPYAFRSASMIVLSRQAESHAAPM